MKHANGSTLSRWKRVFLPVMGVAAFIGSVNFPLAHPAAAAPLHSDATVTTGPIPTPTHLAPGPGAMPPPTDTSVAPSAHNPNRGTVTSASTSAALISPAPSLDPTTHLTGPVFADPRPSTPMLGAVTGSAISAPLAAGPPPPSAPASSCSSTLSNLLLDASFETSGLTPWVPHDYASVVGYQYFQNSSVAKEGGGYLQTSTGVAGGSVWENLSISSSAGDTYEASIWVKADATTSPVPLTGTISLSASGTNATETDSTPFTVGNNGATGSNAWTLVSVPLQIANAHTAMAVTMTMSTPNVNYDWDAASLVNAGLTDSSFESSSITGWQNSGAGVQSASYNNSKAIDGGWYGEMNITTSPSGLIQNVSTAPAYQSSYEFSVWLRSSDGTTMNGYVATYGLGGTQEDSYTNFSVGSNWTLWQAPLNSQNSGHTSMQVQIILGTTGHNLDMDGATLTNSCMVDASMEYSDGGHWIREYVPTGGTVNQAFYTGGAPEDGNGYQEMNTTVTGGAIGQTLSISPSAGVNMQGGFWVRSSSTTNAFSGSVAMIVRGGGADESNSTNFTVGNNWTWVSVGVPVQNSGHTSVILQTYMWTTTATSANLDTDGATLTVANIGSLNPGAPVSVSATSAGNTGNASVSWSAPNELVNNTVTNYTVTPFENGLVAGTAQTVSASPASFTGLSGGTPYTFAVAANGVFGSGPPGTSNTIQTTAVPGSPTGLGVTPGNGQASLSWTAPSASNGSTLTGYAIQIFAGSNQLETETVGTSTSFTVPNLANGQSYTFAVAAINAVGTGAFTSASTAVVPGLPGAPTSITATSNANGASTVAWTAPSSAGASSITGYLVTPYIGSTAQSSSTFWNTSTSEVVGGLTNGTAYTFKVAAINPFGTGATGTSGSATPAATVPGAPFNVSGTPGNAQATISWSAPTSNGGATITGYTITPYIAGVAQATTAATSSPKTVTGLTNGTLYTFKVSATNSVGTGANSAASWNVKPAATPVTTSVAVSVVAGTGSAYQKGGTATYTAVVSNSSAQNLTESYTDTLPAGVSGLGAQIQVGGAACTGGVTCTGTATTIVVTGLTVKSGSPVTITYALTLTGTARQSASLTDSGVATIASGNSGAGTATFTVNDNGLGSAPWWSYSTQALGAGGTAMVNVANGNLLVTQTDAIAMKLHGGLTFALTRAYNSQDGDASGQQRLFGPGWSYSFVNAGSEMAPTYLMAPSFSSYARPAPITAVDGSGARHVFTPSALSTIVDVDALSGTGVLGTLKLNQLTRGGTYNRTCVDEAFTPPAGVHVSMWRYIESSASNCTTLGSSTTAVLGYVTIGADRVRREFNALGQIVEVRDAAGNYVYYSYNGSNQLTDVTETGTSRKFHVDYSHGAGETDITDPGGEVTKYFFMFGALVSVTNADASTLAYAYSGTGCGTTSSQLCSETDSRSHWTSFTYDGSAPQRIASWTDRVGNVSTVTYASASTTTVDRIDPNGQQLHERNQYTAIDSSGRAGEVDQGTTAGSWLTTTLYGWDAGASGAPCRQPDALADNDLCSVVRRATGGVTDTGNADQVTYFTYSEDGRMLIQNDLDAPQNDVTTVGYQAQYFEAGGSVSAYTDAVNGAGAISYGTTSRRDANTLFDVATQKQSLTPRGNAGSAGCGGGTTCATYLTTYLVDNNSAVSTNTSTGVTLCSTPSTPTANTGLVCEVDAPQYDTVNHAGSLATTRITYDLNGQRSTVQTPKAIAESLSGVYTYTYFANTDKDLSTTTSMGGWLKGVTDPAGNYTVAAYDAESHQVRAWDRDATLATGYAMSNAAWVSLASPPSGAQETLYASGSDTASGTYSAPGRFARASRDPIGTAWTTDTVDANGNVTGKRSANGTGGSPTSTPSCPQSTGTSYDTCLTYTSNDQLCTSVIPTNGGANTCASPASASTRATYDAFGNQVTTTDPNGNTTTAAYDQANRSISVTVPRYTYVNSTSTPIPAGCSDPSTGFYSGIVICVTSKAYDAVGNVVTVTDANGRSSEVLYDALHHATQEVTPRNDGTFANLVKVTLYDPDGHVTDVCSPREMSEGSGDTSPNACTSTAAFGTHSTFNPMGWAVTSTSYHVAGTPNTTTTTYDADGNPVQIQSPNGAVGGYHTTNTFNVLDRKTQVSVPQTSSQTDTTTAGYDANGNVTFQQDGAGKTTDRSYDADNRVLDTVQGASNTAIGSTSWYGHNATGADVRTRQVYDLDGNVIGAYAPNAFSSSLTPSKIYLTSTAYNADDQPTAGYQPRYDTASLTDPTGTSGTQETECPLASSGLQTAYGYAATTGICATQFQFDAGGNKVKTLWPNYANNSNQYTQNSYTADNLLWTVSTPSPVTNGSRMTSATDLYDGDGKQTSTTDANGIYTQTAYTQDELTATTTNTPNGATTHVTSSVYDAAGEPVSMTDAVGNVSRKAYWDDGLTLSSTDGAGDVTSYGYDGDGNATSVKSPSANAGDGTNPFGQPTYNFFTENDLLAATVVPVAPTSGTAGTQHATCYGYDLGGLKTGETMEPDSNVVGTTAMSTVCPSTPNSPSFSYTFANLGSGRLTSETGSDSLSLQTYAYDANGNQVNGSDSTSSISIASTFYADNLARTVADGNNRTTKSAYDGLGNPTVDSNVPTSGITYARTLSYNDAGLAASEVAPASTGFSSLATTSWTYDAGGRVTQQNDGNTGTGANSYATYGYAADGSMNAETLWGASASNSSFVQAVNGNYQVTWDGCNTCEAHNNTPPGVGDIWNYQYDAAGRIGAVQYLNGSNPWVYVSYDHNGNRYGHTDGTSPNFDPTNDATTYFHYNADNTTHDTMSPTGNWAFYPTYSATGQMLTDGCLQYGQDAFDRVNQVSAQSGAPTAVCGSAPATKTYAHDALGRQANETVSSVTTSMSYDGTSQHLVEENTASTQTGYMWGPHGAPLGLVNASTTEWMTDDPQGNIGTTTQANGTVQCQVQYDPFGNLVTPASGTNPCESGSTGSTLLFHNTRKDGLTGDYTFGSRNYATTLDTFRSTDRFQQRQPIDDLKLIEGLHTENLQHYVADPIASWDPSGHDTMRCSLGPDCDDVGARTADLNRQRVSGWIRGAMASLNWIRTSPSSLRVSVMDQVMADQPELVVPARMALAAGMQDDRSRQSFQDMYGAVLQTSDRIEHWYGDNPLGRFIHSVGTTMASAGTSWRGYCGGQGWCRSWTNTMYQPASAATGVLDPVTGGFVGATEVVMGSSPDQGSYNAAHPWGQALAVAALVTPFAAESISAKMPVSLDGAAPGAAIAGTAGGGDGLIYLRTDTTGGMKPYVGQTSSMDRFLVRQAEHAAANPDAEFQFEILQKGIAPGDLDTAEQFWISGYGGPTTATNPMGGLSNARNQMIWDRYAAAGGGG